VIIGGLMSNSKSSVDSKIPFLGDIPLLGNLFKRKLRAEEKTELMIFLTPHVVNQPTQLAKMTTDEKAQAELAPKSFTEEELNKFINGLPKKDEKEKGKAKK
jgi:general secretion pathway protein D